MTKQFIRVEEKKGDWLKIEFSAPPELVDALHNFVTEIGADGAFQETLEPIPSTGSIVPPSGEILKAFLPIDDLLEQRLAELQAYVESLAEIFPEFPKPGFRTEIICNPDWGEAWKKYFKPLRVSRNIIIKPTWEDFTPTGQDIVIEIDPGMAFGTGQHPSTRMCLEAIDETMINEQQAEQWSVLDLGTGTGILGIACAKLGAGRVLCVDNDGQANDIARENVRINRVEKSITVSGAGVAEITESFQLVVANLTAKTLLELHPYLVRLVSPGGYLIISGIIAQNKPEIDARFPGDCFRVHRLIAEQEWLCYLLKKEGALPCQ